jgi:hypothetical protein
MRTPFPLRRWLGALAALLLLPGAAARAEEALYTAGKGDSLAGVAKRFGTTAEALRQRNRHLRAGGLPEGARLIVPAGPAAKELPRYRPPLPVGKPLVPCAVKRWPAPVEKKVEDGKAACTTGPSGASVCAVLGDKEEGLFLEEGGARTPVTPELPFMGQVDGFQVVEADLDGDGKAERVLAVLNAVSNGLGVAHWTLRVLEPGRPTPLSFYLAEYGEGTFLRREQGPGCDVLATAWRDLEDPLRGSGLYFIGHRYAYREGALVPVGAPVRVRRFLREFRHGASPSKRLPLGQPAKWLSEAWAEAWPQEPMLDSAPTGQREGTVEAVERMTGVADAGRLRFQVRWDGGGTSWLRPYGAEPEGKVALMDGYSDLGHLPTRQGFPPDYLPARPEALVGTRLRQTVRESQGGAPSTVVVWLSDAASGPAPQPTQER